MINPLVLASGSTIRRQILENAGIETEIMPVKIDEQAIKESLLQENATSWDIADALAEMKAQKAALKRPTSLVLGCDQVLKSKNIMLSKPVNQEDACRQLLSLSSGQHTLLSAAVLYHEQKPVWRVVGKADMFVRDLSREYVENYVSQNWEDIRHCVGCYQIEGTGVQLFTRVQGDQFTIMGLPLFELLAYLRTTGHIQS